MKGSHISKWILLCFILSSLLITVYAHPSNASQRNVMRRGEDDVIDYKRTNVTRTSTTATATATATPTETELLYYALPVPAYTEKWFEIAYGTQIGISSKMMAVGIILMVFGLFLCTMGFRLFKFALAIIGLFTFGSLTWVALANLQPLNGYVNDRITMIMVPVGIGLLGAILYFLVLNIAIYLACAFGGLLLAVFICSWETNLVIVNNVGRACFLGGLALLAGIMTFFAPYQMVYFSTSFIGAYAVIMGVDCLSRTGYITAFQVILNRNPWKRIEYDISKHVYVLLAMTLVLFFIAVGFQVLINRGRPLKLYEVKADGDSRSHYADSTFKEVSPAPRAAPSIARESVPPPEEAVSENKEGGAEAKENNTPVNPAPSLRPPTVA